jgi:uncharacterized peroxidase-related enzyme
MSFIHTIPPAAAEGPVRAMYQQAQGRFGYVPNWTRAFSLRPGVLDGWAALLRSIQSNLSVRNYELATLAAARALRSSYCALAHGSVLADKVFDVATVVAIATDAPEAPLEPGERAVMAFAEKVARGADQIGSADVEVLRSHGYRDEEIFDVAAAAAARCFFSKLLDALGAQPDSSFNDLDPSLRRALTVGRPVDDLPVARLPEIA